MHTIYLDANNRNKSGQAALTQRMSRNSCMRPPASIDSLCESSQANTCTAKAPELGSLKLVGPALHGL